MAINKTKVEFTSQWEIDNLLNSVPDKVINANQNTSLYIIPDVTSLPVFEIMFSPDGLNWYNVGVYDNNGNINGTHAWIEGNQIYFFSDAPGTARLYVWSDKVNY